MLQANRPAVGWLGFRNFGYRKGAPGVSADPRSAIPAGVEQTVRWAPTGMDMFRRSGEFTKYSANAMLATRISFMNERSRLAERVSATSSDFRSG